MKNKKTSVRTYQKNLDESSPQEFIVNDYESMYLTARQGIGARSFEDILKKMPFSISEIATLLHISTKTITRRLQNNISFTTPESERILQLYQVVLRGEDVFEGQPNFRSWLDRENIALGGQKPFDLLENHFGVQLILDELGRIEHGIFA